MWESFQWKFKIICFLYMLSIFDYREPQFTDLGSCSGKCLFRGFKMRTFRRFHIEFSLQWHSRESTRLVGRPSIGKEWVVDLWCCALCVCMHTGIPGMKERSANKRLILLLCGTLIVWKYIHHIYMNCLLECSGLAIKYLGGCEIKSRWRTV